MSSYSLFGDFIPGISVSTLTTRLNALLSITTRFTEAQRQVFKQTAEKYLSSRKAQVDLLLEKGPQNFLEIATAKQIEDKLYSYIGIKCMESAGVVQATQSQPQVQTQYVPITSPGQTGAPQVFAMPQRVVYPQQLISVLSQPVVDSTTVKIPVPGKSNTIIYIAGGAVALALVAFVLMRK